MRPYETLSHALQTGSSVTTDLIFITEQKSVLKMATAEKRRANEMELVPSKKQKTGILAVSGNAGQVAGYVSIGES